MRFKSGGSALRPISISGTLTFRDGETILIHGQVTRRTMAKSASNSRTLSPKRNHVRTKRNDCWTFELPRGKIISFHFNSRSIWLTVYEKSMTADS